MATTLEKVNILHVEDNPGDALLLKAELLESVKPYFTSRGMPAPAWEITCAKNFREAKNLLSKGGVDVILLDLSLPDGNGPEMLREIALAAPRTSIVILSGRNEAESTFETLRGGAQDYLVKGQADGGQIWQAIRFAVERQRV